MLGVCCYLPDEAPEASYRYNNQKEERVMQPHPPPKDQSHRRTQQAGQNTYDGTTDNTSLLSFSSNLDGKQERQDRLEPGHQFGTDAGGKMINSGLVGSAPSLKRQDKGVDGNDDN